MVNECGPGKCRKSSNIATHPTIAEIKPRCSTEDNNWTDGGDQGGRHEADREGVHDIFAANSVPKTLLNSMEFVKNPIRKTTTHRPLCYVVQGKEHNKLLEFSGAS